MTPGKFAITAVPTLRSAAFRCVVLCALAASLTVQGCGKGDKTPAAESSAVSLAGRWECSASQTKIVGTALEPYIGKDKFEMLVEPKSAAVKEGFYFTPLIDGLVERHGEIGGLRIPVSQWVARLRLRAHWANDHSAGRSP